MFYGWHGLLDIRVICKVKKHKVLVLGLGKKDDEHKKAWHAFPKGKEDKSKLKISP